MRGLQLLHDRQDTGFFLLTCLLDATSTTTCAMLCPTHCRFKQRQSAGVNQKCKVYADRNQKPFPRFVHPLLAATTGMFQQLIVMFGTRTTTVSDTCVFSNAGGLRVAYRHEWGTCDISQAERKARLYQRRDCTHCCCCC